MCAQFGNNCLQSYNELHVCGNLMCNTHSIGNKYFSKYLHVHLKFWCKYFILEVMFSFLSHHIVLFYTTSNN